MKNSIHYSPEAQNDLDEIWEYITFELCNPQAAENTVNKIMDTVDELENFSEIGDPVSAVTDIESDYRFLTSGNYMVFYRVNGQDVYIDRVLYGRRDCPGFCFLICRSMTTKDKTKYSNDGTAG